MAETKRPTSLAAEEILGLYFPVLDHGFVSLNDYMGTDECIERAARVSYGYGTRKQSQTRGLLRYLRRHKHTTPSEMVELKFHCCMPIFIARQWIRHRTANVNEYSGPLQPDSDAVLHAGRGAAADAEQTEQPGAQRPAGRRRCSCRGRPTLDRRPACVTEAYEWMTGQEVARELARIDLPLSTYTQWYWKIDLHNLLHFLTLRVDAHAQWEIQEFGRVMAGMLKRVAPLSYEAWIDYDVCGAHVSRMELDVLRALVTPDGQGVRAAGGALDRAALAARGLSTREADELLAKLGPSAVPDFDLDLSRAKSGEHFAERFAAAVPKVDRTPSDAG